MSITKQQRERTQSLPSRPCLLCLWEAAFETEQHSRLEFSLRVCQHLSETYADVDCSTGYTDFSDASDGPTPNMPFPMSVPSFKDFDSRVRRAKNGSAPDRKGVPDQFTDWKYCPSLQHRLYTIVRKVWQSAEVLKSWCQANIVLFHKREKYQIQATSDQSLYPTAMESSSSRSSIKGMLLALSCMSYRSDN